MALCTAELPCYIDFIEKLRSYRAGDHLLQNYQYIQILIRMPILE